MTCSILSAIIASPAPNRYGRQSLLRNAANLAGGGVPAVSAVISSDGAASSSSRTWVGMPQAEHIEALFSGSFGGAAWGWPATLTVVLSQLVPQPWPPESHRSA